MGYNPQDKIKNISLLNRYTLAKTLSMFDYENLPDTIPETELERILQETGKAFIYQWGDKLIAFKCNFSNKVDEYGRYTKVIINNQATNENDEVNVTDGVLFLNDDYYLGLLPLIERYNSQIVENDLSLYISGLNARIQKIISASDDITKDNALQYLEKVKQGDLAIIGESSFLEDLKVQGGNVSNNTNLSELIEYSQYLKSSLLNEIGIQSNTNTKKERLITAEVEQDKENLYPFINNMYANRVLAIEQINEKYGLDIKVKYGSIWKYRNIEESEDKDDVTGESMENIRTDENNVNNDELNND